MTPTIAPAARVCPRPSAFTVDVGGLRRSGRATVKYPGPGDSVRVTVSATAAASAGTPGGSGTLIVSPAWSGADLGGSRVSTAARGRERDEPPVGGCRAGDEPSGDVDDDRGSVAGVEDHRTSDADGDDRGVGARLAGAVVDDRRGGHRSALRPDRDVSGPGCDRAVGSHGEGDRGGVGGHTAQAGHAHADRLAVDALDAGAGASVGEPARRGGDEPRRDAGGRGGRFAARQRDHRDRGEQQRGQRDGPRVPRDGVRGRAEAEPDHRKRGN